MEVTMNQDDKLKGINADFIKQGASKIKEEDVKKVIDRAEEIKNKFKPSGPLGRFIEDFKLLLSILSNYWSGKYKEIPWWAISAIAFGLLYVLNPIDIIPDVIPFIGLVDDALVIGLVLMLIEQELHKYKEWKLQND